MTMIALVGGPNGIPRVWELACGEVQEKVTVDHYGRHVHFERTDEVEVIGGRDIPVFRWAYSTAVAE